MEDFRHCADEMFTKVDQLEQRLNEVEQYFSNASKKQLNTSKGNSIVRDKSKNANYKKRQQDASRREAAASKRMQELMRRFGTILRQITQHKSAGPFLQPVDAAGHCLHDYFKVIEKPMDFNTIKSKMDAKDGTGYKSVWEICADVRLIFENAMKYNEERDDVHSMAKTLMAKFEEKWQQLLPKIEEEEEKRRNEEVAEARFDVQLAQEAEHVKMARDLSNELDEAVLYLDELRDLVLLNCRRISSEEKRRLGTALTHLCPDDLNKALLIVAQNNPNFQATTEEVDLDIDAQSETTLWRLKFFVKEALQVTPSMGDNESNDHCNNNDKRKREICDAFAKTSQKKSKKLP